MTKLDWEGNGVKLFLWWIDQKTVMLVGGLGSGGDREWG